MVDFGLVLVEAYETFLGIATLVDSFAPLVDAWYVFWFENANFGTNYHSMSENDFFRQWSKISWVNNKFESWWISLLEKVLSQTKK